MNIVNENRRGTRDPRRAAGGTKAVVAGHICLDITPVFPGVGTGRAGSQLELRDVVCPGKLTRVEGVNIHTGGSVANTGLALAFFGVDVALMGKVGKDEFGSMVLSLLRERGADKGMIVSEGASTSYSIVIAVPGCDRIFLHDPGANDDFRFSDLDMDAIRDSRLFHFGYPPLMAAMFRNGGEELVTMFRAIDDAGVLTSLDLAAVDENSEAGRVDWERILATTLPYVDFFFPSYEELAFMLDRDSLRDLRARTVGDDITSGLSVAEDVAPLADRAIELGAKVVLVKCGAKGLYYRTAGRERMKRLTEKGGPGDEWADRLGFEESYRPDKILSGTGAGDTTIAAFLAAVLADYPFEECVRFAAATGASCVESYDALGGLRTFAEIEAKIDAGWGKNRREES